MQAPPQNDQSNEEKGPLPRFGANIPEHATRVCPLRDSDMKLRSAHTGGCFYGCSKYPECNGYRNKHDKRPGPTRMVTQLRIICGEAKWKEMERMKLRGNIPDSFVYKKCLFCGMDPCDHLGRHCPMKNIGKGKGINTSIPSSAGK